MNKSKKLSIVIPFFNEEESLIPLHSEIKDSLSSDMSYEIIFIDDGSTDQSNNKIKEIISIDKTTEGQACTAEIGISGSSITEDEIIENYKYNNLNCSFDILSIDSNTINDSLISISDDEIISNY